MIFCDILYTSYFTYNWNTPQDVGCGGAVWSLLEKVAGLADDGPGGAGLCLEADVGFRGAGAVNNSVHCHTTALRHCVILIQILDK